MIQLADARRIITAAEKKAEEIGQPMNVAVVDEGGNLIAFERMANAWLGSIDIAQKKGLDRSGLRYHHQRPWRKLPVWRPILRNSRLQQRQGDDLCRRNSSKERWQDRRVL